jgi:uncharacterized membrane protein
MRQQLGLWSLTLGTLGSVALVGADLYVVLVEMPNWSANVPASLVPYRANLAHAHPGHFFQVFVPVTFLALLASAVLGWREAGAARAWRLAAAAGILLVEVFTLAYFFPRNEVLFFGPLEAHSADALRAAAREWVLGNHARVALTVAAALCATSALLRAVRAMPAGAGVSRPLHASGQPSSVVAEPCAR